MRFGLRPAALAVLLAVPGVAPAATSNGFSLLSVPRRLWSVSAAATSPAS